MITEAVIVYPHQLFDPHPAIKPNRQMWLIEDCLFYGGDPHQPFLFHRHKLILHRASMKAYADRLLAKGVSVHYVDHQPGLATHELLDRILPASIQTIMVADPVDYLLERRLQRFARQRNIKLTIIETPMFLTPPVWYNSWFDQRKRYFMADFYAAQRRRLDIMVDDEGQPHGGKWSYDTENRKKWPANQTPPAIFIPTHDRPVREAIKYVDQHFAHNPGDSSKFWFATTHEEARKSLMHFLKSRFRGFGDYEDAISTRHAILHHSVLTPALNTGLITPREVLHITLSYAREHNIPINDLEGFIRQIIGWREFMRIVYVREGVRQRTSNFWNHKRKINSHWYDGSTGLLPLDHVIKRVNEHAYGHHIERLMILGNAMLLCRLRPDDIYRWFMELFIDAYDWVMVPNVYGMSQFADGGLITTKPYFSGSNYIRKMSDFPSGSWCDEWDALYWRFVADHREFFVRQPRLSMMVRTFDRMTQEKIQKVKTFSQQVFDRIDS
ncbi:MAG TPA: cryptochrome/photolyase family protein [Kiritimatiellia bacterium]|nr:cryptochrome/photolyase family protein [Kiritimatiellia bacterium]